MLSGMIPYGGKDRLMMQEKGDNGRSDVPGQGGSGAWSPEPVWSAWSLLRAGVCYPYSRRQEEVGMDAGRFVDLVEGQ